MPLTVEVTKVSVTEQMNKLWNITLKLRLLDITVEVFDKDFSIRYRTGEDIAAKEAKLQIIMQEAIDDYKAEQVIFDHTKTDTIVTNLNNNLVG
ncbi:hypothetical protein LCGC14_1628200 [marine sediment metagenome]|uniref:Uncharacterized protein n=1 Tax=marine sediment metagenome TaxID=412755 RepID=A0A0F9I3E6_9ZZZZ